MRSGAVRLGVLLVLAALAALFAMPAGRADEPIEVHSAALLAEIGVTPESVVVAGLGAGHIETMRSRLEAASSLRQNYDVARAGVAQRSAELTAAREAAHRGMEGQSVASAESNLATALETLATASNNLFTLVSADLDGSARETLAACRTRSRSGLPPEFWAVGIAPDAVAALRAALRAEARCERRGETLPTETSNLIAAYRENPDVQAAAQVLASELATAQSAMQP